MRTLHKLVRLTLRAAWAPVAVYVLHAVVAGLYRHEPYVDPVMHFLGGAAMAFFISAACTNDVKVLGAPSRLAVELMSFGLTCAVGLIWELGELFSDRFLGSHTQVSVANTLRDLALDALGAVAYLLLARLFFPRSRGGVW